MRYKLKKLLVVKIEKIILILLFIIFSYNIMSGTYIDLFSDEDINYDFVMPDTSSIDVYKLPKRIIGSNLYDSTVKIMDIKSYYINYNDINIEKVLLDICKCKDLTICNIAECNHSFTDLPEVFWNLTKLSILNLSSNKSLSRLSPNITNLVNLTTLDISNTNIKPFPIEICELVKLQILYACNNDYTKIPIEIGKLNKLEQLSLECNKLTILPKEISNLINLKLLNINNNQMQTMPKVGLQCTIIGEYTQYIYNYIIQGNEYSMQHRTELELVDNITTSIFPYGICNFTHLTKLTLGNVKTDSIKINTIPVEIKNLSNLLYLELINLPLTTFPLAICQLQTLKTLKICDSKDIFNGIIPSHISKLTNLETLKLANMGINKLPNEIGKLVKLRKLILNHNILTELPKEICKLDKLELLSIISNKLVKLPDEMFKLTNLKILNISHNKHLYFLPSLLPLCDITQDELTIQKRVDIIKLLLDVSQSNPS